MKTFLELNRHKLRFVFISSSIIFLTLAGIILTFMSFNDTIPDLNFLIKTIVVAGIGFPLFVIVLAYWEWQQNRRIRNRAMSKHPFNQLNKIGFSKSYFNEMTKWSFTEEIKEGVVNDFTLICDVTREKPRTIKFKAIIKHRSFDKKEFKILKNRLKKENIEFDFDGLIKSYNIKETMSQSIEQLQNDLVQFTTVLRRENFEPES